MQFETLFVGPGMRIEHAPGDAAGSAGLQVCIGSGRGASLQCTPAMPGVWIALHGSLQLAIADGNLTVKRRELVVTEEGVRLQARARGPAAWIAVFAPRATWRQLLAAVAGDGTATLVPATHAASADLRRLVLALARAARTRPGGTASARADLVLDFAQALVDAQTVFDGMIARCPGRSLAQRRAVFARLQRVRRYMHANSHLDLDTVALASRANYSLSHFIRSYRRVFDETPHAALVASRLERAHAMLGNSALAVGEVALASGFENRCAFSRVFKRHFGVTAQDVRRAVAA